MFKLKDTETGEIVEFIPGKLLEEINRDRSEEWSEYDMNSTLREVIEIVESMTEYTFDV